MNENEMISGLSERFEKINKLWKRTEDSFKRFPIPDGVWVRYDKYPMYDPSSPNFPDGDGPLYYSCLGYVKVINNWRLCHGIDCDVDDREISWTPVLECPTDVRLKAISGIPRLKEELLKAAESSLKKLDEGIEQFESVLSEL